MTTTKKQKIPKVATIRRFVVMASSLAGDSAYVYRAETMEEAMKSFYHDEDDSTMREILCIPVEKMELHEILQNPSFQKRKNYRV